MKSMTGYGRSEVKCENGLIIKAEIRSYNRKQCDIKLALPSELFEQEVMLRQILSSRISRGSINLKISLSSDGDTCSTNRIARLNREVAEGYFKEIVKLKDKLKLSTEVNISDILSLPNVVVEEEMILDSEDVIKAIKNALNIAIDNLDLTRTAEGEFLAKDLLERICQMERWINKIEPAARRLAESLKDKLIKKLQKEGLTLQDNEDRILREVVIFADRCDISEEITRLRSHFSQFKDFIRVIDESVGRNLDFLVQEIHREITTLGMKAASTEISPFVVKLKTEVEKIREQVQNIE